MEDVQQFAEQFELFEQLRGKSFLITGATGLIGSVMVKCLLELNKQKQLGINIVAIARNYEKVKRVLVGDYMDIDVMYIPLSGISQEAIRTKIDYIIHLASPTESKYFVDYPVETLRTTIGGTAAVLEFAKLANVEAMVYASSLEVYGNNMTNGWINEAFQGYVNPTEVRSSYNIGKRTCDCLCHAYAKEYGINVMIARLTQTFGPGIVRSDSRVFAQFVKKAIEGKDIVLHTSGESSRPYCYTTDAVSAILYLLINGKKGEAYNIANKKSYISIRDMAEMIRDNFNPQINVKFSPKDNLGYAPETKLRLDTSKIESLGWEPKVELKTMYARLIEYLKS